MSEKDIGIIGYVLGGKGLMCQYLLITRQGAYLSLNISLVGSPQGSTIENESLGICRDPPV